MNMLITQGQGALIVTPLSLIKDHNGEGYDSVDSEDFDPGYGCVPLEEVRVIPGPPDMPPMNWTKSDQWNYEYEMRTEGEKQRREDEYLRSQGVNI